MFISAFSCVCSSWTRFCSRGDKYVSLSSYCSCILQRKKVLIPAYEDCLKARSRWTYSDSLNPCYRVYRVLYPGLVWQKKICNTLLGLHNSSHPTQTYSIIANSSPTSQVLITLLWCFSSDSSFFFSRFTSRCKVSTWAPSLVRASNSDLSRLFCKVLKHWIEHWTDHFEHSSWIKKRTIYWVIKESLGRGQTSNISRDEPSSN